MVPPVSFPTSPPTSDMKPSSTIFTTEYSIRTAMEAVYTLLNVDRGVPEVWGSVYDIRDLLNATIKLRDGKKATDMDMNLPQRMAVKELLKKIEGTDRTYFETI